MASNVSVGFEDLQQAASQLSSGKGELVEVLQRLEAAINGLTGSGFKTHTASNRFSQHYQQWSRSTTQLVSTLDEISRAVRDAQAKHQQVDQTLAAAVGTAGAGAAAAGGTAAAARAARSSGGSGSGSGGGTGSSGSPGGGTAGGGTGRGTSGGGTGGGGRGGGTGGGPPGGSSGGGSGGGGRRGRGPRVRDPRFESVPSNRVNERLQQIDRSNSTGWARTHDQGDRYAYDRVRLGNGQEATRTQGMQVTVDKSHLRTTARDTSPPADLKSTMPGYRNADGTNNEMQLGHLWADRLGGPNAARNFVPVYPHINGGAMAYVEGRVAAAVNQHGSVRLVALPNYTGNNVVPDSILYAWKAPGAEGWTTVLIKNAPRGT